MINAYRARSRLSFCVCMLAGAIQTTSAFAEGADPTWSKGRAEAEETIAKAQAAFQALQKKAKPATRAKGRVIGFVIDAETGAVPEDARIVASQGATKEETTPEEAGVFEVKGLTPGVWKIEAQAKGYRSETQSEVTVNKGVGPGHGTFVIFRLQKEK